MTGSEDQIPKALLPTLYLRPDVGVRLNDLKPFVPAWRTLQSGAGMQKGDTHPLALKTPPVRRALQMFGKGMIEAP